MITALDRNTALVLIDLQNGILQIPLATPVTEIIHNAVKLVAAFRKANLPVVIVNVDPAAFSKLPIRKDEGPGPGAYANLPAGFVDIVPEIKTEPGDILITKHTWGAFHETSLEDELSKRNVTGIVLAGVATSAGVESTARSASERNYNIAFAQDAMTDRDAAVHQHSVTHIFPRLGEVGDTESIINKLAQANS